MSPQINPLKEEHLQLINSVLGQKNAVDEYLQNLQRIGLDVSAPVAQWQAITGFCQQCKSVFFPHQP